MRYKGTIGARACKSGKLPYEFLLCGPCPGCMACAMGVAIPMPLGNKHGRLVFIR